MNKEKMTYDELAIDRDRMKAARDLLMINNARLKVQNHDLLEACKAWLNDETDDGTFADTLRLIIANATRSAA